MGILGINFNNVAVEAVAPTILFLAVAAEVLFVCRRRNEYRKLVDGKRSKDKQISIRSDLGQCFGADIGGTLCKLVYFEHQYDTKFLRRPRASSYVLAAEEMTAFLTDQNSSFRDTSLAIKTDLLGGTIHFMKYETRFLDVSLDLIAHTGMHQKIINMACTGGGAHKYEEAFKNRTGINFDKFDELSCLLKGVHFLLKYVNEELYTFKNVDIQTLDSERVTCPSPETYKDFYPFLLVNIGSGVSILKVDGPTSYQRVSGTSIGGGTYWGLCRLLTKCKSFDEVLQLAETGNNAAVDMMVEDIYGRGYDRFNLTANTLASSFGKLAFNPDLRIAGFTEADIARALLYMVTFHITQLAYLNAVKHGTKRIFFVGNFMRHNNVSNKTAAFAINYWSGGAFQAQFFKHEGYFGALGAFLFNLEKKERLQGGLIV